MTKVTALGVRHSPRSGLSFAVSKREIFHTVNKNQQLEKKLTNGDYKAIKLFPLIWQQLLHPLLTFFSTL